MLKYIKKHLFKYPKNNNNSNNKTKQKNLLNYLSSDKKKMSENFLKVIKDSGLSHEEVLKVLKKEGKLKDPKTYAEFYKVEEAKRLEKEKVEKEKAEKEKADKDKGTPAEPATPPAEPAEPETPATPPETPSDPMIKRMDEFEAKMVKLIKEGSRIPLATPSAGVESENKKPAGDFSLALDGKYEKYV